MLGEDAVADGWRLACRHVVAGGETELVLPADSVETVGACAPTTAWQERAAGQTDEDALLAVDVGTTSVYWQVLTREGALLGEGHCLNPQAGAGSDVVSRLALARSEAGRHLLARAIRDMLGAICRDATAQGLRISRMCLAGNTAMTDVVLERDISGLCAAPYRISHPGNEWVQPGDLPPMYVPPLPAPFVGGDVSAGLACLVAENTPRPFVLADMGTNGELALVTEDDRLFLTSVPLGPALEGIGPACGQQAGCGVVTAFGLGPFGLTANVSPTAPCRGISATGYLSLLAHLLRLGILDAAGHFAAADTLAMPLARKIAQGLHTRHDQPCLNLPCNQWLEAGDVELLLKVRACFVLALQQLLRAAAIPAASLKRICLAGALGEHVDPQALETLGFVPQGMGQRVRAVGNTSLRGAALLARDSDRCEWLARWCAAAQVLPLAEQADFQEQYMQAMRLEIWS